MLAALVGGISLLEVNSAVHADVSCQIDGKVYRTLDACIAQMQMKKTAAKQSPKKDEPAAIPPADAPPQTLDPDIQRILSEGQGKSSWTAYIRQSMDDLKSFDRPSDISSAKGALFSWTNDRVQTNKAWVAQGLAAVRYQATFAPQKGPY
jgi:hypothetical protein